MSVAREIAEWALGLSAADVPARVRKTATRHLLDGTGTAIAAARSGMVQPVVDVAARAGGPEEATVLGYGLRLPAPAAALANGALVHALDFDDTHAEALVHATAAVLPAAFAAGEETKAGGASVLTSCIAGYEIVARLGAAVRHGFHARGFHATSVCGVFASALVAARLYDLDIRQTTHALGIAGSMASGSLEFLQTGSSTKQMHPGFAAASGITAARLAAAGADGPETIFEGTHGLYRAFLGASPPAGALTESLGERWETERITIKPYPVCQLSQASLDALRSLGPLDTASIEEITFAVPPESIAIVCEPVSTKRRPRTPYEGKFSLQYSAAALLTDGTLSLASFQPEMLGRPEVLAVAARIGHAARAFDGAPADAPGIVTVRMRDGRILEADVKRGRGTPEEPLGDDEILEKFAANGGGDTLARAMQELDHVTSLDTIMSEARPA